MAEQPTTYQATIRLTISPDEGNRIKVTLIVTGSDGSILEENLPREQAENWGQALRSIPPTKAVSLPNGREYREWVFENAPPLP